MSHVCHTADRPKADAARRAHCIFLRLVVFAFTLGIVTRAAASVPGASLRNQYSIAQWGHRDGLPSPTIYSIAQTPDGFLWLGTADGLIRFDGITFTQLPLSANTSEAFGKVHALYADSEGSLWAGSEAGTMARLGPMGISIARLNLGSAVSRICSSGEGGLNAVTQDRVLSIDPHAMEIIGSKPLQPDRSGRSVPCEEKPLSSELLGLLNLKDGQTQEVFQSSDLDTWIATKEDGVYVTRVDDGTRKVERLSTDNGLSNNSIWAIYEDRERDIWIGTQNGLNRLRRTQFETYTRRSGLLSSRISSLASVGDSSYFGSSLGLNKLSGGALETVLKDDVLALAPAGPSGLWMSTNAGLFRVNEGQVKPVPLGAKYSGITALSETTRGDLWFYDRGSGLHQWKQKGPALAVRVAGVSDASVMTMAGDNAGGTWVGWSDGRITVFMGNVSHTFSRIDHLPGGTPHSITADADGSVWIASENGLAHVKDSTITAWNKQDGLPGNRVLWAVMGIDDRLWLGYNTGVSAVSPADLQHAKEDQRFKIPSHFYDDGEGLRGNPDLHGSSAMATTKGGDIWFTSAEGVTHFNPTHFVRNEVAPLVHVLGLVANDQNQGLHATNVLPAHTRRIEITYTGLSFTDPTKVTFRYRLLGFESDWHEASTRRVATYTDLRPREYIFEVTAANGDGVSSSQPDTLRFTVMPAFYQTTWFLTLLAFAAVAMVLLLIRFRLRLAADALRLRYEERIDERSRVAQDLHDNLLQELMGMSLQLELADELTPDEATGKPFIRRSLHLAASAMQQGRASLQTLRAPISLTMGALFNALREATEITSPGREQAVHYSTKGAEMPLVAGVGEDILHITREALRNALLHTDGPIEVHAAFTSRALRMSVRDVGAGIPSEILTNGRPGHFGLAGMRERASRINASLNLRERDGGGTSMELVVPAGVVYEHQPGNHRWKKVIAKLFRRARARNRNVYED